MAGPPPEFNSGIQSGLRGLGWGSSPRMGLPHLFRADAHMGAEIPSDKGHWGRLEAILSPSKSGLKA